MEIETYNHELPQDPALGLHSVKPSFFLPAIKGGVAGCLNCGYTDDILPLDTKLYSSFGGWMISKNGIQFFREKANVEYDNSKPLSAIELIAKEEPQSDWRAHLDLPLRSATYQRQGDNNWILVERGEGFA
ncbi:MAG: hypothetical protein JXR39_11475 [Marinilabiliaceae bacterium]|nr:hypothetical protein [Marinilabiliaceae bacterium]